MTREEAIKKIKKSWDFIGNDEKEILETLVPELAESEDEKIRKAIIEFFESEDDNTTYSLVSKKDILSWLEKQGEQNLTLPKWKYKKDHTPLLKDSIILNKYGGVAKSPSGAIVSDVWVLDYDELAKLPKEELEKQGEKKPAKNIDEIWKDAGYEFDFDMKKLKKIGQKSIVNVKAKFLEGEWVVNKLGDSWHIDSIDTKNYQVSDGKGNYNWFPISKQDEMHLWTINDAKEGDVLCTYECDEPKIVFIIKGTPKKHYALSYYCYYNIMYPHFKYDSERGCLAPNDEDVKPATKEQRDTLFAKMKDACYDFDFDKKVLKKIEE